MYAPKLGQAMFTALVCVALIALGAKAQGRVLTALNIGAFLFALITAVILWLLILQAYDYHTDRITELATAYSKLDDEGRAALAFQFPALRYRIRKGKVREYFEDTNVTVEQFRLFLQDSNQRYIAPERNWNSMERPRAAWQEIKDYLEMNRYILEDSASGNHSWLWSGNSYQHLMAYWTAGKKIIDFTDMETA